MIYPAVSSSNTAVLIRATVQELEDNGYLVRRRLRSEQGRLPGVEYDIYEKPQS
jgi:hypothetical protein